MSMPDKWEYPWFAAWDLAFHCVALAHVDPAFAKYQLILLCREWFQHPNGALPAYEWDFGDVNPPVQAWAAVEVFAIDGARDIEFISRVFDKLLVNFTWWVNREDAEGNNLFEGGFLGLDNIGPIDRSHLPVGGVLEQSDATGWMGFYAIAMASMAVILNRSGQRPGVDLVLKFMEHFAAISEALEGLGLWDEADGLYYDRLVTPSGAVVPVKVRSMVGIIPVLAAAVIGEDDLQQSLVVGKQFAEFLGRRGLADREKLHEIGLVRGELGEQRMLLSLAGVGRLEKLFAKLFDESEFLSPHGLRALSAWHRDHPYELDVEGVRASIDYEPAESTTAMFGGNSNWRGPIWFPLNYLVISVLERYHRFFGDEFTIEYPTGSGRKLTLDKVAADLQDRLISIFTRGPDGRRPCFGGTERMQTDPAWHDNLIFSEYFHGDNGAAIGAFHQTGWTGLIADVIRRRHGAVDAIGDVDPPHRDGDRAMTAVRPKPGAARAPGQPVPARRDAVGRRHELRRGLQRGRRDDAVPVRRRGPGNPDTAAGLRRRRLARLRPRGRARAGLRVPRHRPLRSGAGPALQPGEAAARPLRPGDQRRGRVRAGGAGLRGGRPGRAERTGLRRAHAAQPGHRRAVRLDRRPPGAAPLLRHDHLRGARQGVHHAPPGRARRAARHLRRARARGGRRPTWWTSA